MKIDEGNNIFENMRLILPEHRTFMERAKREAEKRPMPKLSQQEQDEMTYTITEALELRQEIRIVLYHPYEHEIWIGVPEIYAGALHVWMDEEKYKVPMDRLIHVCGV